MAVAMKLLLGKLVVKQHDELQCAVFVTNTGLHIDYLVRDFVNVFIQCLSLSLNLIRGIGWKHHQMG